MANIHRLRAKLAEILEKQKEEKPQKRKYRSAVLYMNEHLSGKSYAAIARKYGVSRQAVQSACERYRRWMDQEKEGAEDGK